MTMQRFKELVEAGPKIEANEIGALMQFTPKLTRACANVRLALWLMGRAVSMR